MEDETQKSFTPPNVALVTKGSLRAKGSFVVKRPRKFHMPFKAPNLGKVLPRSKRLRAMKTKI